MADYHNAQTPEDLPRTSDGSRLDPSDDPERLCWYTSCCGRIEFQLKYGDALSVSHSGRCDDDVNALRRVPYVKTQLDKIRHEDLARELREWGAWDDAELRDHDQNLNRILWLAGSNIRDNEGKE